MFAAFFSKTWIYLGMALAAALAVLAVLAGARQAGKNAQKVADAKETINAINARTASDTRIQSASDADLAKLRSKWQR